MRVLQIGVGGVGESIAKIAQQRDPNQDWLELMVLADYNEVRAHEVAAKLGEAERSDPEGCVLDDETLAKVSAAS